jgi:hypothetical protein
MTRRSILQRYSRGEITAREAAYLLGGGASVADVYVWSREERLPLPLPPQDRLDQEVRAGVALCHRAAQRHR